tara:strand:- start:466 stop:657 length:192 start_codon:yes stop_codon:yes gene_type:complete
MRLEHKTIKVSANPGEVLDNVVQEAYDFSYKYKVEVELQFNGVTHTISQYTAIDPLIGNWFKS